jgi:hypothetical protein
MYSDIMIACNVVEVALASGVQYPRPTKRWHMAFWNDQTNAASELVFKYYKINYVIGVGTKTFSIIFTTDARDAVRLAKRSAGPRAKRFQAFEIDEETAKQLMGAK